MRQTNHKRTLDSQDGHLSRAKNILVTLLVMVTVLFLFIAILFIAKEFLALLVPDNCDSLSECIRRLGPPCVLC